MDDLIVLFASDLYCFDHVSLPQPKAKKGLLGWFGLGGAEGGPFPEPMPAPPRVPPPAQVGDPNPLKSQLSYLR